MIPDMIERFTKPKDKAEKKEAGEKEEISDAEVVDIAFHGTSEETEQED